jgi:hypothetical protein
VLHSFSRVQPHPPPMHLTASSRRTPSQARPSHNKATSAKLLCRISPFVLPRELSGPFWTVVRLKPSLPLPCSSDHPTDEASRRWSHICPLLTVEPSVILRRSCCPNPLLCYLKLKPVTSLLFFALFWPCGLYVAPGLSLASAVILVALIG